MIQQTFRTQRVLLRVNLIEHERNILLCMLIRFIFFHFFFAYGVFLSRNMYLI